MHLKDITRCQWDRYRGVRMLSLCGIVHGIADGVPHTDLASGTDAIIGTDVLGSVLPHTLDMKNGILFTEGGASLQLHHRNDFLVGFSQLDTALFLLIRSLYCIVWYVLLGTHDTL